MAAPADDEDLDYRFSLANERTYLAWIRTALALIAGGIVAAKALNFHHDWLRWVVAVPPVLIGTACAVEALARWRTYETVMRQGRKMQVGRGLKLLSITLAVYALVALAATIYDG